MLTRAEGARRRSAAPATKDALHQLLLNHHSATIRSEVHLSAASRSDRARVGEEVEQATPRPRGVDRHADAQPD